MGDFPQSRVKCGLDGPSPPLPSGREGFSPSLEGLVTVGRELGSWRYVRSVTRISGWPVACLTEQRLEEWTAIPLGWALSSV